MRPTFVDETELIEQLPLLHEVQMVDQRISALLALRTELDSGAAKEAELGRAKARLEQVSGQLSDLRGRQVDRRLEKEALLERREKNQHRLWQENPTQQEAEALQMDLQSTATRLDKIEIDLLDFQNRIAPLEDQVEDEGRTVSELEGELEAVRTRFAEEVKDIDIELSERVTERGEKAQDVHPRLMERYDRIRERRGDPGVVKVTDEVCGACHTQLTSYMLRQLHFGRRVQQCENCNTILYWAGELRPTLSFEEMREASDAFDVLDDDEE